MLAIVVAVIAGLASAVLVKRRWLACLCAGIAGTAAAFVVQHYVNLAGDAAWSVRSILQVSLGTVVAIGIVFLHRWGINQPTSIPRG